GGGVPPRSLSAPAATMNKPAAQRPSSRSRGEWLKRLGLILASIVATLLALEIGLRASTGGYLFAWPNFVLEARTVLADRDGSRFVHDDRLGYLPRAGYAGPGYSGPGNIAAGLPIRADRLRPHCHALSPGALPAAGPC